LFQKEGEYYRAQVKTCRVRKDRDNAVVVNAKKRNGKPYSKDDCDVIIGVLEDRVFIFPCEGYGEYWATEEGVGKRWEELRLTREKEN